MPHATEFTPEEYPPFPSSPEFKTVDLQTISLKKLLAEDATEQDRVFEACKTRGFFYLELGDCESGETILKGADDICRMAEDVFKLPMEVKEEQRMREGQLDGYKRAGATITDKAGKKRHGRILQHCQKRPDPARLQSLANVPPMATTDNVAPTPPR